MRNGFSLIEVLVALFIIMVMSLGIFRIATLSIRSNAYAEAVTYASVLGHTKLVSLQGLAFDSPDLKPQWHQDPLNPISCSSMRFYRFWQVDDVAAGKRVELFTAWIDPMRGGNQNSLTEADVKAGLCTRIALTDIFVKE